MSIRQSKPALLFVCLGNICRSPLAHGVAESLVRQRQLDWRIDSAGTGDWHIGRQPDPRSIAVARRAGMDISGQRARQVRPDDFAAFSHIIAMDSQNLADLRSLAPPAATASLSLLLSHAPGAAVTDVPDPYYDTDDAFDGVLDLVRQGVAGLIASLPAKG